MELPATAARTAATAATTTTAEAAATAAAAAPVACAAPCTRRLRLFDLNRPAVKVCAVEPADGLLRFLRRRHLDEAEAARSPGVPVGHDARGFDAADRCEGFAQTLVRGRKRQTAHEEFHRHGRAPSDRTGTIRSIHWSPISGTRIFLRCDLVGTFIEQLGYAGVFLILFAAGLGAPVPEELPIITAGILAHQAVLRWWLALPVCFAGVLSGDVLLYWVGHHWGETVLGWRPVRWVLSPVREEQLTTAYRNHPVKIVFTARHVMGLRAAAFLTAGIARVPFWKFLAVDAVAALVSVPFVFFLAFLFADQVEQVFADVHRMERWAALVALVAIAAWVVIAARRRGRRP